MIKSAQRDIRRLFTQLDDWKITLGFAIKVCSMIHMTSVWKPKLQSQKKLRQGNTENLRQIFSGGLRGTLSLNNLAVRPAICTCICSRRPRIWNSLWLRVCLPCYWLQLLFAAGKLRFLVSWARRMVNPRKEPDEDPVDAPRAPYKPE